MYILLFLITILLLSFFVHALLSWTFSEPPEDCEAAGERLKPPRSFYNPRTWAAYHRLAAQRPAKLSYRRDKRGRFRKML